MPIIIEGPDGAGKSTLAKSLADAHDAAIVLEGNDPATAMEEVLKCML